MTIKTHIVTGFLGAGKTTLIQRWLASRADGERWAVLVNEFGQIGIDQAIMSQDGVMMKEVPGGCICCAQSMALQIALAQIIEHAGATRLLIEPTGLGHPAQLVELLTDPVWQSRLSLGASACVIDARQLQDRKLLEHETFQAQVAMADALLFSKADSYAASDRERAIEWAAALKPEKAYVEFCEPEHSPHDWMNLPTRTPQQQRRSLLHRPQPLSSGATPVPQEPPYHYQQSGLEHVVGGWIFPASWQFNHHQLLGVLMSWQGLRRCKGVFHTEQGWISFNATAVDLAIRNSEYRADNRVELIAEQPLPWPDLEQQLLACLLSAPDA